MSGADAAEHKDDKAGAEAHDDPEADGGDEASAAMDERSLALACRTARVCDDKRADQILVLDMEELCGYCDFFVLATVTSQPQMRGILKDLKKVLSGEGCRLLSETGVQQGGWAVLDYGEVVIHVFDALTREYYQLEELWGDAPQVAWEKHPAGAPSAPPGDAP